MRFLVINQSVKQLLYNIANNANNIRNVFYALGILSRIVTEPLNSSILSKNSLAVRATILKGNYQLTSESLMLAICTKNAGIVESIINLDAEVNLEHLISAIDIMTCGESKNQQMEKIIKALVNTMRTNGQKIDSKALMHSIKREDLDIIKFLLTTLNIQVKEEHITFASNGHNKAVNILENFSEKQNDAEKIKNLRTLGSGAPNRNYGGFFAKMPEELIMNIVSLTGNKSKPVTQEDMQNYYYNKPKL